MGRARLGVTRLFLYGTLLDEDLRAVLAGPLEARVARLSGYELSKSQTGNGPVRLVRADGFVDGLDFIIWNANKFTESSKWCEGDFNADGLIDGLDFIIWNANKFANGR